MLDVQGVSDGNSPLSQNSYVIIVLLKCLFVRIPETPPHPTLFRYVTAEREIYPQIIIEREK